MFDQINGLPVHILIVHAAVVFVPLLALGAIVYALVARVRLRIGWAVGALAVVAPICALIARLSGEELYDRLIAQGVSGRGAELLEDHMNFGNITFWLALALGVVTLISVILTGRKSSSLPRAADLGLGVVMIALAAAAGYYVFQTGDSGAFAVWGEY